MQSIIMKMKAKNVLPALAGAMLALQASAQHWGSTSALTVWTTFSCPLP